MDTQQVPAPVLIANLALVRCDGINHRGGELCKVRAVEVMIDPGDGLADVGGEQVKESGGERRKVSYA